MNTRNIRVCLTPALFHLYSDRKSIVVVVDVLRATSAICVAMDKGVEKIIPVSSVEEALDFKGMENHIIAAERNGKVVQGFDFGNSPIDYSTANIKGKTLVVTTTNGTKAINMAKKDHQVAIGSFLNIDALSEWLLSKEEDIVILCAGWKDDFCFEDTLFAGALIHKLVDHGSFVADSDSTKTASLIFENAKDNMYDFLNLSEHRRRLADLNIDKDVHYCLKLNTTSVIPIIKEDVLIALR
jgi:2-phosphosulfolactate phosphatase